MARYAEVIGAGIGGLTAATALAKRGWRVRVNEKAHDLRLVGAGGLSIFENGLRILEAIGAYEEAVAGANHFVGRQTRDAANHITSEQIFVHGQRAIETSRTQLMGALHNAALRAGVEVISNSDATSVEPSGRVHFANHTPREADLVIVADGVNSVNRDSLGLHVNKKPLKDGAIRLIVPRKPSDALKLDRNMSIQWWSGSRRILAVALNQSELYLALTTLDTDNDYKALPLDKARWKEQFPALEDALDRVTDQGRWDRFVTIKLNRWSKGKVAVIGDAAHAMAPNLGQGGACAMMGAIGLAASLDQFEDVIPALASWEKKLRPLIDHTQRWSTIYSAVTTWPPRIRSLAFGMTKVFPQIEQYAFKAIYHRPTDV